MIKKAIQLARSKESTTDMEWPMEVVSVHHDKGTVIVRDLEGGGTDTWDIDELEFKV